MHIENCFPQLPRKLTNRSCRQNCSFEPSGPMDTMVQLFRLDLSWKTVLATFKSLLSFCLGGTCDTLTSLSNLHSWCIHSEPSCYLCSKAGAQHLTFLVPVRLPPFSRENSLTTMIQFCWLLWWPYKLSILPIFLESLQQHINFVRPGTKTKKSMKKPNTGLLHVSPDWRFMSDFTGKLLIPSWIVISQRRPDIVIF